MYSSTLVDNGKSKRRVMDIAHLLISSFTPTGVWGCSRMGRGWTCFLTVVLGEGLKGVSTPFRRKFNICGAVNAIWGNILGKLKERYCKYLILLQREQIMGFVLWRRKHISVHHLFEWGFNPTPTPRFLRLYCQTIVKTFRSGCIRDSLTYHRFDKANDELDMDLPTGRYNAMR